MSDDDRKEETSPQEVEASPEQGRPSEFERVFTQYDKSMTAIREFFSQLTPLVGEMEKGILKGYHERVH